MFDHIKSFEKFGGIHKRPITTTAATLEKSQAKRETKEREA